MAKKYYVVWEGRETGIFTDWNTCKKQIDKFAGAKYKSFKTLGEAEAAFHGTSASPVKKNSTKDTPSKGSSTRKKTGAQGLKTYTADEIAALLIDTKILSIVSASAVSSK